MMDIDREAAERSPASRLKNFTAQEREAGLHPAIRALHARAPDRDPARNSRAVHFARIQRGHQV